MFFLSSRIIQAQNLNQNPHATTTIITAQTIIIITTIKLSFLLIYSIFYIKYNYLNITITYIYILCSCHNSYQMVLFAEFRFAFLKQQLHKQYNKYLQTVSKIITINANNIKQKPKKNDTDNVI